MKPAVELVSTGSELLNGQTLNQHARLLGERLANIGFLLLRDTTVPDDLPAIQDAIRGALERADVVIVSGGMGPTADDVTPEAVAGLLGRRVVVDSTALAALQERYHRWGRHVTPSAERQARVVESAVALPNPVGLAPGERLELRGKTLFLLPGPPAEFLALLEGQVLPWLDAAAPDRARVPALSLMVCGLGESDIVHRFEKAGFPPPGITVAYRAAPGRIEVRLESKSPTEDPEEAARRATHLLGGHVFSRSREELEAVVGRLLREAGKTMATAESCTGGGLGAAITAVSGSSAWYRGGVIAYANDLKTSELGVPPDWMAREGAVSARVVQQMALGVRERFGSDFGLGITGIAGPLGGTPEKPVGLVFIALAFPQGVRVRRYCFGGDRARVREWSVRMALDMLRRHLQNVAEPDVFGTDGPGSLTDESG